ncbi:hypothetical protein GY45DRAFT_1364317 [Cubamyces sp. BRFM 1775]|nr:hypothetical protein GY45DRAFT_1364317 [Cubamyces sp. BRFM 1775]
MAPKGQKSDSFDKADPRRPHIILRTLPSFSFSTPSQSVDVHFSLHVPQTPQDKLRLMDVPDVPSVHTFGPGRIIGSPTPSDMERALANRTPRSSSPHSSTSSTNDRISTVESRVSTLERKVDNIEHELKELKGDVQELKGDVQELKKDVQELKISIDKKMDQLLATVEKKMDQLLANALKERGLIASAPPVPAQLDIPSSSTSPTSPVASQASPTITFSPAPASPTSPATNPMSLTADDATPDLHKMISASDLRSGSGGLGKFMSSFNQGDSRSAAAEVQDRREEKAEAAPSTPQVQQEQQQPVAGPSTAPALSASTSGRTIVGQLIMDPATLNKMV